MTIAMPKPAKILALDDSLTMRKLVEMVFKSPAYDLRLAETGAEGVGMALSDPPDLILLDYILPDMKGGDVCRELCKSQITAGVPILVISGKGDSLRDKLSVYSSVKGFVPKPFTPPEIGEAVVRALSEHCGIDIGGEVAPEEASAQGPAIDAKKAAGLLYKCLKSPLSKIPQWLAGLGDDMPAKYFARKILTPDVVERVMTELGAAQMTQIVSPSSEKAPSDPSAVTAQVAGTDRLLFGSTAVLPLLSVVEGIACGGKTGILTLESGRTKTYVYFRSGELLAASSNVPGTETSCPIPRDGIPREHLVSAEEGQARDGTPVFVFLASKGLFSTSRLPEALAAHTRHAVSVAGKQEVAQFVWQSVGILPAFVDAHGKSCSVDLLRLDGLREVQTASMESSVELPAGAVFRRCSNFSARIAELPLSESERAVLTLVNGRSTIAQVIERGSLPSHELHSVIVRLARIRLIVEDGDDRSDSDPCEKSCSKLLVLEGADSNMSGLLAAVVADMAAQWSVARFEDGVGIVAQIEEQQPDVVLFDGCVPSVDLISLARSVRGTLEVCETKMIAVVRMKSGTAAEVLAEAGFDMVVRAPFLIDDIRLFLQKSIRRTSVRSFEKSLKRLDDQVGSPASE